MVLRALFRLLDETCRFSVPVVENSVIYGCGISVKYSLYARPSMDDFIPFAAVFAVMGVFAWTTWPKQELLGGILITVAVILVGFRAAELA